MKDYIVTLQRNLERENLEIELINKDYRTES